MKSIMFSLGVENEQANTGLKTTRETKFRSLADHKIDPTIPGFTLHSSLLNAITTHSTSI